MRTTGRTTPRTARDATRRAHVTPCRLCRDKVQWVDYKDVDALRTHLSDRGRIRARRVTGNCARHQHEIAMAIKTARQLGLLPYAPRAMTEGRAASNRSTHGALEATAIVTTADTRSELSTRADMSGGVR